MGKPNELDPTAEPSLEAMEAALTGGDPLPDGQRQQYAERLLDHALLTRDPEAGRLIARLMDADDALDAVLNERLNAVLPEQPDAVYVLIRNHLAEECDDCWLPRLKLAATASLQVAIRDADAATIGQWLTLIAREPANYDLSDVLHQAIQDTQPRAAESPELAYLLVALAAKRDPTSLDRLLDDPALIEALPNNVGRVLRDFDGDPLALLQKKGIELFMVGMARAAQACAPAMFTPASVASLWELYVTGQSVGALPHPYQPDGIIQTWVDRGVRCLNPDALEALATLMLSHRRDDLFLQLIHQPNGSKLLLPRLVPILERSHRTINDALNLIGRIVTAGDMLPQQAADAYLYMLEGLEWQQEAQPLAQQLARALQKYPSVMLPTETYWHLLEMTAEVKDEFSAKVIARRLTSDLEPLEDEGEVVEQLKKLLGETHWSEAVHEFISDWWRDFIREQPLPRLSKLSKVLDGKRVLEEERHILETLIAVRRMLNGRDLRAFATEIRAAFSVLEAISESFDPDSRRAIHFDPATARAELDVRADDLSPQEQQILANHLKQLAQIIAAMGDNRTRANLIRRGDDLDRELMTGEETPHSAVDAMKWLAGYWGGTQEEEEEEGG
ncbi:MAG: hypothetical protein JNM70_08885 [Anaerolineae bacterium]|nr:hypothetical protein [Anaerolineae bacterium]